MTLSEFALVEKYFAHLSEGKGEGVAIGIGDDCAVLEHGPNERFAISVDTTAESTHFPADAPPHQIAHRAVAVALSDLAAMGATPRAITLALTIPEANETWLSQFSHGLAQVIREYGVALIGGDTCKGRLSITVQVLGILPRDKVLTRAGAAAGDHLYVSGHPGDAAAALQVMNGNWLGGPQYHEYLLTRFYRPRARIELGRSLLGIASAAIDVSDGLLADAGHIAAASGVRCVIDPKALPLSAALLSHPDRQLAVEWGLTGGDDYELCFSLPPGLAAPEGCSLIGELVAGEGVDCGADRVHAGYRHF